MILFNDHLVGDLIAAGHHDDQHAAAVEADERDVAQPGGRAGRRHRKRDLVRSARQLVRDVFHQVTRRARSPEPVFQIARGLPPPRVEQ